jgi:hypothetical protein
MPSSLQVDQIQSADGVTTYLNSGTLSNLTFPSGHFIKSPVTAFQTAQVSRTTSGTTNCVNASITVDSTSDKILVYGSCDVQIYGNSATTSAYGYVVLHDSTGNEDLVKVQINNDLVSNSAVAEKQVTLMHLATPSQTGINTYYIQIVYGGGRILTRGNDESGFIKPCEITLFYIKG